jgi:predicted nucleotidyltransferase
MAQVIISIIFKRKIRGIKSRVRRKIEMRVDVVTYNSLHSLLRDQILAEQIEIL